MRFLVRGAVKEEVRREGKEGEVGGGVRRS